MTRIHASYSVVTIAVFALAAAAAMASGSAYADDITIDTMPAVLTASRDAIKAQALQHTAFDEWTLQRNQVSVFKSSITAEQAKAQYAAARDEVSALNAEDSGSTYFWKMPRPVTSIMGAPAR
jgi:CRISPR/Cas system-associated endoribonuclease Cas2